VTIMSDCSGALVSGAGSAGAGAADIATLLSGLVSAKAGGAATLATASAKSEIEDLYMAVRSPKKTGDLQSIRPQHFMFFRIRT
ncbi:hypothetical protein C1X73_37755, partial [Pseudomonas sp. FW305-130]